MDEAVDTQSAILMSATALLRQRTFEDISYLDLADAVSVSERTIYRRFPTRSHLLEALGRWIEAEHFPMQGFATPAEFRAAAQRRFRAFEAEPAYAFVAARGVSLSPIADGTESPITSAISAMVRGAAPTLNPRDALRVTATMRYFASPLFWARMRTGFDMNAEEVVAAFDAAMDSVLPTRPKANRAA
ncbi:TetR/AcrR family transcriptional regulator [Protaetiibacter intestinalis]|uniref:TetR/AcrR family transcriptional regulator n=1 Tax=Protaetiibacter intestinalis TaxID=2419774 RepID=A0A387B6J2_9MICO|nr:TetR/AcrR family transcriptional regulator [Protaetiibacter intestinalis]AYF97371.1 TetR/AcrR family transcriptional regulator [Protaetiibacter intestinalis]